MLEEDKQVTGQQKGNDAAKEGQQHSHKDSKDGKDGRKPQKEQAGMSTDPQAMKDEGYVKRIDEKTSRH